MTNPPPMFQLDSVTKNYGNQQVLSDVSLAIAQARTTVLIGPSGAGKSTVFTLLTGLLTPDLGTVFVEGVPLTPAGLPALRRRLGYVIQDGGLFPHLTGRENVTVMAEYLGWTALEIQQRIAELAELARLTEVVLARYPVEMSGGQRQRISLMRALMLDADVLLLDEPLGALDPMVRAELQNDLAAIFRRLGKTVVLVTHDLEEAAFFADQVILMNAGRVVQIGTTDDLIERPAAAFVRHFVLAQQRPG